MTQKEDKVGKQYRKFQKVKNSYGKVVRQGKPIIVKSSEIIEPIKRKERKTVKVNKETLKDLFALPTKGGE